jgi:hypothetical protein
LSGLAPAPRPRLPAQTATGKAEPLPLCASRSQVPCPLTHFSCCSCIALLSPPPNCSRQVYACPSLPLFPRSHRAPEHPAHPASVKRLRGVEACRPVGQD